MRRFAIVIILAATTVGVSMAQHDVTTSITLDAATRSELFRVVYDVDIAAVDSARVWLSSHQGQDTTVSVDVLLDELQAINIERLREWEAQYIESQQAAATLTF